MAKIVWAGPALSDLEAIADFIALDNSEAAADLVRRVFKHVDQLAKHPESGSRPQELKSSHYRQIVEPPCRVFYRFDGRTVFILHVMRAERSFRKHLLSLREKGSGRET